MAPPPRSSELSPGWWVVAAAGADSSRWTTTPPAMAPKISALASRIAPTIPRRPKKALTTSRTYQRDPGKERSIQQLTDGRPHLITTRGANGASDLVPSGRKFSYAGLSISPYPCPPFQRPCCPPPPPPLR